MRIPPRTCAVWPENSCNRSSGDPRRAHSAAPGDVIPREPWGTEGLCDRISGEDRCGGWRLVVMGGDRARRPRGSMPQIRPDLWHRCWRPPGGNATNTAGFVAFASRGPPAPMPQSRPNFVAPSRGGAGADLHPSPPASSHHHMCRGAPLQPPELKKDVAEDLRGLDAARWAGVGKIHWDCQGGLMRIPNPEPTNHPFRPPDSDLSRRAVHVTQNHIH